MAGNSDPVVGVPGMNQTVLLSVSRPHPFAYAYTIPPWNAFAFHRSRLEGQSLSWSMKVKVANISQTSVMCRAP